MEILLSFVGMVACTYGGFGALYILVFKVIN
jgi:hypothetical protein